MGTIPHTRLLNEICYNQIVKEERDTPTHEQYGFFQGMDKNRSLTERRAVFNYYQARKMNLTFLYYFYLPLTDIITL